MEQHNYKEYLVIKILSKNSNKYKKCECIRSCWIRTVDEEANLVVFGYPLLGDNLTAALSVINYEPLDYEWPQLYGKVLCDTNHHDEALKFLEKKNIRSDVNQTKHTNEKVGEITALKQISINLIKLPLNEANNYPSHQKNTDQENKIQSTTSSNDLEKKVDLEISAAHDSIRRYTRDLEYEDIEFSSTSQNSHDTEMPDATNQIDDEAMKETPVNNEIAKKNVERPRRKSISKKSYCEISDDEYDNFDDSSSDTETANSDSNIGIPNSSRESIAVGVNNFLDHKDLTMNLLNDPVYAYLYNFYVDINDSYQKTMSRFDSAADYVHKIITAHKDKLEARTNQSSTDKHIMETMKSISDPPSLLQESVSISHKGDKWTLRYPKPGYGLIELLPNTGVYVSQEGLDHCKLMSTRTTELTRHLLKEVFTDKALKMCTPTGKRRFKLGLNSRARDTLIDYVLKYSSEKCWEGNLLTVTTCIQNVLTRSRQSD